jgi:hypothetical protein
MRNLESRNVALGAGMFLQPMLAFVATVAIPLVCVFHAEVSGWLSTRRFGPWGGAR